MPARRLALVIALAAGLVGSQGPEFAQQYRQRLGGALDELRRIVAEFDAEASRQNLTPADAVQRLEANADPLARKRGEDIDQTMARENRLEQQFQAMASAGPLKRLYVMVTDFDPEIARSALEAYEPAAPITTEALTVGSAAAVLGWAATHLVAWPFRRRRTPPQTLSA